MQQANGPEMNGKVALVTGSSDGIGFEVARELRAAGATVVLNGRNPERLSQARKTLEQEDVSGSPEVHEVPADVEDPNQAQALVVEALDRCGRLDILVNNAGRTLVKPSLELADSDWLGVVSLNLTAPFICSRTAAKAMIEQGGGVIVNIGSIFGVVGSARRVAYCATKHGLVGMTRALASEWGPVGIRVCVVNPGYVDTPMVHRTIESGAIDVTRLRSRIPAGRLAEGQEVARLVRFLTSDDAAYANGAEINLDGGWLSHSGW